MSVAWGLNTGPVGCEIAGRRRRQTELRFHCWPPPRAAPQSLSGNIIKYFCNRFHTRLDRNGTRSLNYNIKEQQTNKKNSPRDCFNPLTTTPTNPWTSLYRLSTPDSFCSTSYPFPSRRESTNLIFNLWISRSRPLLLLLISPSPLSNLLRK